MAVRARASRRARAPRPGRARGSSAAPAAAGPGCARAGRASANSRARAVGEPVELALLLAEALHDAHAGDVFLDDVGDLARLLLRVPARGEHRRAQPHRGERAAAGATSEHHERRAAARAMSITTSDTTNIRMLPTPIGRNCRKPWISATSERRAAHELAGLQLVVAREVEALELAEDRGAQVVLHVERDAAAAEAAEVREDERERRPSRSSARATARAARSCVGDDVVDDDLLHERQQRLDELAADRDAERDVRVLLVRLHVADQPPDPALLLRRARASSRPRSRAHLARSRAWHARRERVVEIARAPRAARRDRAACSKIAFEPLGHLALGRAQRARRRPSVTREPDRPPVARDRLARRAAPLDEPVDHRGDRRLGHREPLGEQATTARRPRRPARAPGTGRA